MAFEVEWRSLTPSVWRLDFQSPSGEVRWLRTSFGDTGIAGEFEADEVGEWLVTLAPEGISTGVEWSIGLRMTPLGP